MRVGIDIPYFAAPSEIRDYAQAMEGLGFAHLGFSQHLCSTLDSPFPNPVLAFDDPWREPFTLGAFLAAVTTTVEINPAMLLLPLYPPVLAAKQAAEIDNLSGGGRIRLAVSRGWNDRECEALGVDPTTRGARLEEQIEVMRKLWSARAVDHHGRFFTLSQTGITPRPPAPIPIWLGAGRMNEGGFFAPAAIERAARVADGFKFAAPTFTDLDRVARLVDDLRAAVSKAGRDGDAFGIELRLVAHLTTADDWPGVLERARSIGATHVGVANRIAGGTVADQIAWATRFADATRSLW